MKRERTAEDWDCLKYEAHIFTTSGSLRTVHNNNTITSLRGFRQPYYYSSVLGQSGQCVVSATDLSSPRRLVRYQVRWRKRQAPSPPATSTDYPCASTRPLHPLSQLVLVSSFHLWTVASFCCGCLVCVPWAPVVLQRAPAPGSRLEWALHHPRVG
jgi:hypothetical protein